MLDEEVQTLKSEDSINDTMIKLANKCFEKIKNGFSSKLSNSYSQSCKCFMIIIHFGTLNLMSFQYFHSLSIILLLSESLVAWVCTFLSTYHLSFEYNLQDPTL